MFRPGALDNLPKTVLTAALVRFFEARASAGEPLVLITVLATRGSTYSKTGTQVLVDATGRYEGLVSGGCLEQDLVDRALHVIATGEPQSVEYDLFSDDEVFGLGIGCDGAMTLSLQRLDAASCYEPFAGMLATLVDARSTVVERAAPVGPVVARFRVHRPRRVLVLGAGKDVEPLARLGNALGWQVTVADHRQGHVERLQVPAACEARCTPLDQADELVSAGQFDAVIVMSHQLTSDRRYLEVLAKADVPFVGLLGPKARRARLVAEIDADANAFEGRLRSPVGLKIGGQGPAAIALEVVAELQQFFSQAL